MPELPEVETMRRGVRAIVGEQITAVRNARCPYRPIVVRPSLPRLQRRIQGKTIASVERSGKRLVLALGGGDRLVFEPRMTGLVLLAAPPDREHLRLVLELAPSGRELLFWDRRGLGQVRLYSPAEYAAQLGPERLGPDALKIELSELRRRLSRGRRAIKAALLDQRAVSGIGNLYASEILHLARIHPERPCRGLSEAQWRALHDAMRRVLRAAIKYEGSTLSDGTYRNALNQAGGYQNHHRVYDRADERCPSCGKGVIRRIVQAQRATFYCGRCQR